MSTNAYQVYENNAVNTASGAQLTLMLYNGAIKFIRQAQINIKDNDYEAKNTNIQKAQTIIKELMITLDPEVELSKQIMPLYEYIHYLLTEANIKHNSEQLEEALTLTMEFRDTWKQVIIKTGEQSYAQGAQV